MIYRLLLTFFASISMNFVQFLVANIFSNILVLFQEISFRHNFISSMILLICPYFKYDIVTPFEIGIARMSLFLFNSKLLKSKP